MEIVETSLYKELEGRKDEAARYYRPFLDICKYDIAPFLENIKRLFPEYPDHGMGHSVRILQYLGTIMNEQMKAFLTSMDLLILIFACLFHDSGMALINANEEEAEDIRKRHPEHAEEVICKYFDAYFNNMHEKERVVRAIVFVCKAHGYSLDELLSSEEFDLEDSIKFSEIHYGVLAFLLRIGDLLDIEDERSNSFRMLMFSESFNQLSKEHNLRHLKLKNYVHRADRLEIKVKADNVTQYKIWHEWFEYLKNDINMFNSTFAKGHLSLPKAHTQICKADGSNYEVQELRFEIDDKGGMWDILSKSVYTNDLDFLRELLQNAIDASLKTIYLDKKVELKSVSPRGWNNKKRIIVCFSRENKKLIVVDNGIGMNRDDLVNYLFKLSSSGQVCNPAREFSFPGIAQYGIGFIACLIHASKIDIFTSKSKTDIYKVSLEGERNLAFIEKENNSANFIGTSICLTLKHEYTSNEIGDYIRRNFCYPSVPIDFFDIDKVDTILREYGSAMEASTITKQPFMAVQVIEELSRMLQSEKKEHSGEVEQYRILNEAVCDLKKYFDEEKEAFGKKEKLSLFQKKYEKVRSKIEELNLRDKFSEIVLTKLKPGSSNYDFELGKIYNQLDEYERESSELFSQKDNRIRRLQDAVDHIGRDRIERYKWDYFVGYLDEELKIKKAVKLNDLSKLGNENCILLIRNSLSDFDNGIEYEAISGFFLNRKKLATRLEVLDPVYSVADEPVSVSTWELAMNIDEEIGENDYYLDDCEWLNDEQQYNVRVDNAMIDATGRFVMSSGKAIKLATGSFRSDYDDDEWELFDIGTDIEAKGKEAADLQEFMEIISFSSSKYCQDGIRIEMPIGKLFKLGFFSIVCNCTAKARMKLNVTRHEISQIREDVDNWMNETGRIVQKSILDQISDKMKKEGVEFSKRDARNSVIEPGFGNLFERRSVLQLKALLSE